MAEMEELSASRSLSALPVAGFAVTPELRSAHPGEDDEGWEYLAMQDAATGAAGRGLRVVAAADLPDSSVGEGASSDDPAEVTIIDEVSLRRIASLHVLDPAGERDVDSDFELSWYDVTELDVVIDLVRADRS
nr:hypothetical protein [Rudaeicoccus suwonensis]